MTPTATTIAAIDADLARHPDGGDDRVEREHDVEQRDLNEHRCEGRPAPHVPAPFLALELVVDFLGALPHQEQPPGEQDQVAPGIRMAEQREQGLGEVHDPGDGQEQQNPRPHRDRQPEGAGALLLRLGQPARENRNEDDVVDAEDDLERREGEEGDPGFGGGDPGHGLANGVGVREDRREEGDSATSGRLEVERFPLPLHVVEQAREAQFAAEALQEGIVFGQHRIIDEAAVCRAFEPSDGLFIRADHRMERGHLPARELRAEGGGRELWRHGS